jgi:hypothetical protein
MNSNIEVKQQEMKIQNPSPKSSFPNITPQDILHMQQETEILSGIHLPSPRLINVRHPVASESDLIALLNTLRQSR